MKCCFRCCLLHWLETTRLADNIRHHHAHVDDKIEQGYTKHNPNTGDFGMEPLLNLLWHPHAISAVSDVHMHPMKGCHITRDLKKLETTIVSFYHVSPEKAIFPGKQDQLGTSKLWAKCCPAIRGVDRYIIDAFNPVKYAPTAALLGKAALVTANNVANWPDGKKHNSTTFFSTTVTVAPLVDAALWSRVRERVIGVRGVSLWQAFLEHPLVDQVQRGERLLLCCCMNVDDSHIDRMCHSKLLAQHAEFLCPLTQTYEGRKIGPPKEDPGSHQIEAEVILMLNDKYGTMKGLKGNYDAHLPVLMRGSRFVFSPNGTQNSHKSVPRLFCFFLFFSSFSVLRSFFLSSSSFVFFFFFSPKQHSFFRRRKTLSERAPGLF